MISIESLKEELDQVMEQEIILLELFCKKEEEIKSFILRNEWAGLERVLKEFQPITEEIDLLEKVRNDLFIALKVNLGEKSDAGFYQTIVHFSPVEREKSAELYRKLKRLVLKIQGITWSIDAHVRSVTGMMYKILNEHFPHRKGKIYSRRGSAKSAENCPMVVNKAL